MSYQLNDFMKGYILGLLELGKTEREVQEIFQEKFERRVSRMSLNRIKYRQPVERMKRGPKDLFRLSQVKKMISVVQKNKFKSWDNLIEIIWNKHRIGISKHSLRKICKNNGIKNYRILKKPKLTSKAVTQRLDFCRKHLNKGDNFWKRIIFLDEKTITIKNQYEMSRLYVKCQKSERLLPSNIISTTKFVKKGIKFIGAMTIDGVLPLIKVENRLNSQIFTDKIELYRREVRDFRRFKILMDNDPSHSSKFTTKFLNEMGIKKLEFPSSSPDLNVIENTWAFWQKNVRASKPKSTKELEDASYKEWYKIPKEYLKKLVESMKRRISAVIASKGYITKY